MKTLMTCLAIAGWLTLCSTGGVLAQAPDPPAYIEVEEGIMDIETGLVWGHDAYNVLGTTAGFDWARTTGVQLYEDWSNGFFGREDSDWRLPTVAEMEDAIAKDIVLYTSL